MYQIVQRMETNKQLRIAERLSFVRLVSTQLINKLIERRAKFYSSYKDFSCATITHFLVAWSFMCSYIISLRESRWLGHSRWLKNLYIRYMLGPDTTFIMQQMVEEYQNKEKDSQTSFSSKEIYKQSKNKTTKKSKTLMKRLIIN